MPRRICLLLCLAGAVFPAWAEQFFSRAQPIWPEGGERTMNSFVGFQANFDGNACCTNELVLTKGVGDRPTFTLIMLAPCYGATEYEIETCVPYSPK